MADMVKQESGGHVTTAEHTRDNPLFTPRFDIFERDDELVLWGDLPGVTAGGLDIDFENKELTIRGRVSPRQEGSEFLLAEYGVDYVLWGPAERALGEFDPGQAAYLRPIYDAEG